MQDFCIVKNTFLDFHDEIPTHATDMRKPRSRSEPPLRLDATATLQTSNTDANEMEANPEHGFARSVSEPVSAHSQHHVASCCRKPEPFGNADLGFNACDTKAVEGHVETSDCLAPWPHRAGCDDFNLATEISNLLFVSEPCVGGALPGACNDRSNFVDNMGSQPYQNVSCNNSAHEWNNLGMDNVSRFHAHGHVNLHHSTVGNDWSCSTALCNSKHEHVSLHEPTSCARSDLWGPKTTTVMIRQIPRWVTQQMLVAEVVKQGFSDYFNFLYLPWERKRNQNMGYAFLNFLDAKGAIAFKKVFDGLCLNSEMEMTNRPLRVHPAAVQGYQANYQHFMRTKIGRSQNSNGPIFLEHHTMAQKHKTPPVAGLKKQTAEQWQYPATNPKYQANVLQPQSSANGVVPVEMVVEPALVQQSTNKLRGRQSRAPATAINDCWSGEQNVRFKENVQQYTENGTSRCRGGNSGKSVHDDVHAALGHTAVCLACGKPCGGERLSFCHCCSQRFEIGERQEDNKRLAVMLMQV